MHHSVVPKLPISPVLTDVLHKVLGNMVIGLVSINLSIRTYVHTYFFTPAPMSA